MALNSTISLEIANFTADAIAALLDDGYLCVYDGTQPLTPDDAVTTQNMLAELRFSNPAFGAASGGTITADTITQTGNNLATGLATWFRTKKSDGVTGVMDGSVGTSNANMIVGNPSVQVDQSFTVNTFVHTVEQG